MRTIVFSSVFLVAIVAASCAPTVSDGTADDGLADDPGAMVDAQDEAVTQPAQAAPAAQDPAGAKTETAAKQDDTPADLGLDSADAAQDADMFGDETPPAKPAPATAQAAPPKTTMKEQPVPPVTAPTKAQAATPAPKPAKAQAAAPAPKPAPAAKLAAPVPASPATAITGVKRVLFVKKDKTVVRSGPSQDADIVRTLAAGDTVLAVDAEPWAKLSDSEYISRTDLSTKIVKRQHAQAGWGSPTPDTPEDNKPAAPLPMHE